MTDDRIISIIEASWNVFVLDLQAAFVRHNGYYSSGHYGRLAYQGTVETLDKIALIKKQIGEQLHAIKDEAND